jgi:hypothetical protein
VAEFCYNMIDAGSETILAIADSDIIGKVFEEGNIQIDVRAEFFGNKTCKEAQAKRLIKSPTIINAVGKRIIKLLLDEGKIDKNMILVVNGVPHAQCIKI